MHHGKETDGAGFDRLCIGTAFGVCCSKSVGGVPLLSMHLMQEQTYTLTVFIIWEQFDRESQKPSDLKEFDQHVGAFFRRDFCENVQ